MSVQCSRLNGVELFDFTTSRGINVSVQLSLSVFMSFSEPIRTVRSVQLHSFPRNGNECLICEKTSYCCALRNLQIPSALLHRTIFLNTWQSDLLSSPACKSEMLFSESLACWPQTTAEIEKYLSFSPGWGRLVFNVNVRCLLTILCGGKIYFCSLRMI